MAKITIPNKAAGDTHTASEFNTVKDAINSLYPIAEAHNPVLTFDKNKYNETAVSQSVGITYTLAGTGNVDGTVIRHKILSDGVNPITFNVNDFNVFNKPENNIYPVGIHIFYFSFIGGEVDVIIPTYKETNTPSNTAPTDSNDSYSVDENEVLTVTAPGVLTNAADVDGDTITAIKVTDPSNGNLTLNSNGSFTYTPNTDYFGSDSFTYKANDGTEDGPTRTVTITVNEVVTGDTTKPTITTATVENANPNKLVVVFSEVVNITDATGFTITGAATPTVSNPTGTGTNTITFTLSTALTNGQSVTLNVAGTNTVTDTSGNTLNATTRAITNNVAAASSGTQIVWEDFVNTSSSGNGQLGLTATGSNSGAYSGKAISNNVSDINGVKFSITDAPTGGGGIGLANAYTGIAANGFNMKIWMQLSNDAETVKIFESGTKKYEQPLVTGDVAEIRTDNEVFKCYINNTLVYTSAQSFNYPLTAIAILSSGSMESEILNAQFLTDTNLVTSPL